MEISSGCLDGKLGQQLPEIMRTDALQLSSGVVREPHEMPPEHDKATYKPFMAITQCYSRKFCCMPGLLIVA